MLTEAIELLKNIAADLEQVSSLSIKVDSREEAVGVCEISEHIQLARYHLSVAINRLNVSQCFEKK